MSTRRILIVDDERLARVSLADFLQEAGYEAIYTHDGESALRLQREQPFDVCVVGIRMPDMDGIETTLALRRIAPDSCFIIYTGSPQFTLPLTLKQMGLSERDIVRKPVLDMNVFLPLIDSDPDLEANSGIRSDREGSTDG